MKKLKICGFIVTHNRLDLLKKCYASLAKQSRSLDELIIINNSSTDGTGEWLETLDDVTIITQENTGGAGGFRRGFDYAFEKGYDWTLQFDDDCEPALDYVEKAEPYLTKSEIKVCSGRFFDKGRNQFFCGAENSKWFSDQNMKDELTKTEDAGFPFLFVHKDIYKNVGFPYKFWFIYLDDQEWIRRIRKVYDIYILPIDAGMHHSGRDSKVIKLAFGLVTREIPTYGTWKTYYFFRNVIVFNRIAGQSRFSLLLYNFGKLLLINFQKGDYWKRVFDAIRGIRDGLSMNISDLK
ncbi:MAG: glycosyltransferase [Reichenbachiella sp.]|uniref:glycosyltransferase n=1 Tax=Reichenbachiella sp. TaxID=2184521 RepID=UPI00329A3F5F